MKDRDWIGPVTALAIFAMWPISTGYFYNRPVCATGNERGGQEMCAVTIAFFWPFTLPANLAARMFAP